MHLKFYIKVDVFICGIPEINSRGARITTRPFALFAAAPELAQQLIAQTALRWFSFRIVSGTCLSGKVDLKLRLRLWALRATIARTIDDRMCA